MLPTNPLPVSRSTCNSCATPCWITATRVSCRVTLIRISSLTTGMSQQRRAPEFAEQLVGLEQRQPHHAGVAPVDGSNEDSPAALNGIGTRLVERFAAGHVLA